MIAWEWESAAQQGYFKFYKTLVREVTPDTINRCANCGERLSDAEIEMYFSYLLKPKLQ